ncbi:MAG: pantoate--beta-alanine ligase [Chitinophagales bacterium]
MIKFDKAAELTAHIAALRNNGKTVGFTPTMGALHNGHLSLIKASKAENDITICSVFVNPTQFDKATDLDKYPRTLEADAKLLESVGCDILFFPSVEEVYPNGTEVKDPPAVGKIVSVMEGEHRIGHFEGMMQVVERLLRITTPHRIYMGLKDYQQFAIVSLMVKVQEIEVEVKGMPIVREDDGLAMSSRNVRLTPKGRKEDALILSKTLLEIKAQKENYSIPELEGIGRYLINQNEKVRLEYFEIVDTKTLFPVEDIHRKENIIALTSVWVDGIKLLDNMIL